MKKQLTAMALSVAMLAGAMPITGWAESTSYSNLNTTANQNIYGDDTSLLIDNTYQYCVEGDTYFAYMWVPQSAEHLNGVMFAKSNLSEARLMQSKTVRDVLAKYNIGIVYMHSRNTTKNPAANTAISSFEYRDGGDGYNAGAVLDELMARFAAVSGYDELRYTPFIGVGHSAGMGPGSEAFHGGFGMINYQGIKKPAFHAYKFLNLLGDIEIKTGNNYIVTKRSDTEKVRVLAWNYESDTVKTAVPMTNGYEEAEKVVEAGKKSSLSIKLSGLKPGTLFSIEQADSDNGCAMGLYKKLGYPSSLTQDEIKLLKNKSESLKTDIIKADSNGVLEIDEILSPWAIIIVKEM